MTIPESRYSMTWTYHNGPDWYGVDYFVLKPRVKTPWYRRAESFRVTCEKHSSGAVPARMVELRAVYDAVHRNFLANDWAPFHMVERFTGLIHSMDLLLEIFTLPSEGTAADDVVRRACTEAYKLMGDFNHLDFLLNREASRRGEMGFHAHKIALLEASTAAREEDAKRFNQLHRVYSNTMYDLREQAVPATLEA